jgi:4-amino-4-deoxy-L-arabinose transferase-like glycosyltransferase
MGAGYVDFAEDTTAYFQRRKCVLIKAIEHSDKNRDLINVSILLWLTLCIGIFLIVTTVLISKDGITYIKYSQQIEANPVKTIVKEYQHPGYPLLILTVHKMTGFLHKNTPTLSWIYCAQSVTLLFRLLAIVVLYFIARQLFGARMSFWSVLILILLPKPAEYGSDALSDWPHLFFLLTGLLFLLKGAMTKRWWLFSFAGLAAGSGYLIRPECAQLVVLGSLWLGLQLLLPGSTKGKIKVLTALALLLAGFLLIAGPYINLKKAVFPKKNVGRFTFTPKTIKASKAVFPKKNVGQSPPVSQQPKFSEKNSLPAPEAKPTFQFKPLNIPKAFGKLVSNTGETLMWFFVPAMLIGMYNKFKVQKWYKPEKFFIIAIIFLNIPVMIWLYCKYDYMSYRHTLPLLLLPILYIPVGLQELAIWFQSRFSIKPGVSDTINLNERFWFLALLLVGVSICAPKLIRPIGREKQGFRAAAQWIKDNTDSNAIVAVPDRRISFYAGRKEFFYENENIPKRAKYIVKRIKKKTAELAPENPSDKLVYEYIDKRREFAHTAIFKRL